MNPHIPVPTPRSLRSGAFASPSILLGLSLLAATAPLATAQTCLPCDVCLDTSGGRTIITSYGGTSTSSELIATGVNNQTYSLYGWFSSAVTGANGSHNEGVRLSGSDICTLGGTIHGTLPSSMTWKVAHDLGGHGIRLNVASGIANVIDARIHNVEDGFKSRENSANSSTITFLNTATFNVRDVYMTGIRDDAVENDNFLPGTVEDGLFDGVFTFYSEQDQSGSGSSLGTGEDNYVRLTKVLVRTAQTNALDVSPNPLYTAGRWFKLQGTQPHHVLRITDSAFGISAIPQQENGQVNWNRTDIPADAEWYGTNYILWLGTGTYGGPTSVPSAQLINGATVTFLDSTTTPTAQSKWDELKRDWLQGHGYLPAGLTATAGSKEVTLTWQNNATEAASFNVLRKAGSGGTYTAIATGLANTATSYLDAALTNGTTYTYVIEAVDRCDVVQTTVEVSATPQPITVSFQNGVNDYAGTVDTTIKSDAPTTNFNGSSRMMTDGSPDYAALVKWDLSSIPANKTVLAVTLTFNVENTSSDTYEFYALTRSWSESDATWNKATASTSWGAAGANDTSSDRDSTVLGTITASSESLTSVTLNAAGVATVQSWIDTPSGNQGFIILDYANHNGLDIDTREEGTAAQRPKITITYE